MKSSIMLGYPVTDILGYSVYERPPLYIPKLKLSPHLDVDSEFRKELDAWLLEKFGHQDDFVPDEIFVLENQRMIVGPPGTVAKLREKLREMVK